MVLGGEGMKYEVADQEEWAEDEDVAHGGDEGGGEGGGEPAEDRGGQHVGDRHGWGGL